MSTVLIAWELGAGLGHVARLAPIATALQQRGHRVVAAVRDIAYAGARLIQSGIACFAAPHYFGSTITPAPSRTFAHILHNVGFGDRSCLDALVSSWNTLFDEISPDIVLFDHSPTALLASRGRAFSRVLFGDGFCCPPDGDLLPSLIPWNDMPQSAAHDESQLLENGNAVLKALGRAPLRRLSALYAETDAQLLTTFAELDHFGPRRGADYFGPCTAPVKGAKPISKANMRNMRAVAYLHPFAELETLMLELRALDIVTTIYCPGNCLARGAIPPNVTLVNEPIDLERAMSGCEFAILNATHSSTASALLAGRPIFQIPLHHEQQLVAANSSKTGAALAARGSSSRNLKSRLREFIGNPEHARNAMRFAERYRSYRSLDSVDRVADRIECILANAA